jgi:hypothetical protein
MKRKCKHCSNNAQKNRLICSTCLSRQTKKTNPFLYFFNALRNNTKRRGIPFLLSLAEFKNFAIETDYIKKKGTSQKSLTIDRLNDQIGYQIDNIQVLTNSQNAKKSRLYYDIDERKLRVKKISDWSNAPPASLCSDCPF